jgi:hypothetical protein
LAEVDPTSHAFDLYFYGMLRPTKTDERIKALAYQLDNLLVHQFLFRLI